MIILFVLILLAVLTLAGVAIPYAMAAATFLYFFVLWERSADMALSIIGLRVMDFATNYAFMAVPLFVFYGRIAEEMQARDRLAALLRRMLGTGRIGAAVAEVVSGLVVPDAAGEALLNRADTAADSINRLRLAGASGFAATAQAAALTLMRTLMPPGIIVFVLAIMVEESIARAWIGLAVLGMSIGVLTVIFAALSPADSGARTVAPVRSEAGAAIWAVVAVVVVFLLVAGFSTPTEVAAIAVLVAMVAALTGGATWRRFSRAAGRALQDSGMIFLTMALASALAFAMTMEGSSIYLMSFAEDLGSGNSSTTIVMFLAIALISSALGPLLTLLVAAPLIVPAFQELGMEPGTVILILATAAALGSLIPPLGPVFAALAAGSSLPRRQVAATMGVALVIGLAAVLAAPTLSGAVTFWLFGS